MNSDWLLWLAGAAAALALLLGAVWLVRRRPEREAVIDFEPPIAPAAPAEPAPQPAPQPIAAAIPEPALTLPPKPAPQPAAGLEITLEARRMSASLMATTLSYQLTITNHTAETLDALAIEGDMVAAHASLPTEAQIAQPGQRLELRHAAVSLAPGASIAFTGDIRISLTAITPIRAGNAAYMVPLARFRVEAGGLTATQTFVVGEDGGDPQAALRPFRLDLGPRNWSQIGQRAVG